MMKGLLQAIYRVLISLKFAVVLLVALTLALITATTLESVYDTPTAQYFVYRAPWFFILLLLLGLNILAVALSRLPWKKRHLPFLSAHAGILLLLIGAWMTHRWGVDGMLRVEEGETQATVEIDEPQILIQDADALKVIPYPWRPPGVEAPQLDLGHGISVERYLARADAVISFEASVTSPRSAPAVQLKFTTKRSMGGMPAMAASQEIWLWRGSPEWQSSAMGPAQVFFGKPSDQSRAPWISLEPRYDGSLAFEAVSMRGEKSKGLLSAARLKSLQSGQSGQSGKSLVLDPGWKAIQIEVLSYLTQAIPRTEYVPAKIQYGPKAPPSAIQIRAPHETLWLGLGDRASFAPQSQGGSGVVVAYFPRRVTLPFGVRLERFMLDRYPGSFQAASFSSKVRVEDLGVPAGGLERLISMNEPLEWKGFTFYQSSYEEGMPRPTVSIFSVNQDPGRGLKYLGSLVLVLGIVWFYVNRMKQRRGVSEVSS